MSRSIFLLVASKLGNVHGVITEPTIEQAYSVCRSVTKTHAKTFYAASHFIPASKRDACYAVYAFCRYVDDLIDVAMERGDVSQRMQLPLSNIGDQMLPRSMLKGANAVWTIQLIAIAPMSFAPGNTHYSNITSPDTYRMS